MIQPAATANSVFWQDLNGKLVRISQVPSNTTLNGCRIMTNIGHQAQNGQMMNFVNSSHWDYENYYCLYSQNCSWTLWLGDSWRTGERIEQLRRWWCKRLGELRGIKQGSVRVLSNNQIVLAIWQNSYSIVGWNSLSKLSCHRESNYADGAAKYLQLTVFCHPELAKDL